MATLAEFDQRQRIPERMDDTTLDPAEHRRALAGLARINRVSGSAELLWPRISRLARRNHPNPIRILDVATGAGDVPIRLASKARSRRLYNLQFFGCDISETAIETARRSARDTVTFFQHDILAQPIPDQYDIVTCSLFLHHLDESDSRLLLRRMSDAASRLVLVNDLARGPVNYGLVWLASRLLSRSPVVHFDGPASVRSAFTPQEALTLAEDAGLYGARVFDRPPCRYLLVWSRP